MNIFSFILVARGARKEAATKWITSFDMWEITGSNIHSMIKSITYIISGCSPNSLNIRSLRLPFGGPASYPDDEPNILADLDPLLPHLTGLHILGPTGVANFDQSCPLLGSLMKCTSLKHLSYTSTNFGPLVNFLKSQPKLDSVAVLRDTTVAISPPLSYILRAIKALKHRPKLVAGPFLDDENSESGWSTGVEKIILTSHLRVDAPNVQAEIQKIETLLGTNLSQCYFLYPYLDPFSTEPIPLIADVMNRFTGSFKTIGEIFDFTAKYLPPNLSHYQVDAIVWSIFPLQRRKDLVDKLSQVLAALTSWVTNDRKFFHQGPDFEEFSLAWKLVVIRGTSPELVEQLVDLGTYKPFDLFYWAFKKMSHFLPESFLGRSIPKITWDLFKVDIIRKWELQETVPPISAFSELYCAIEALNDPICTAKFWNWAEDPHCRSILFALLRKQSPLPNGWIFCLDLSLVSLFELCSGRYMALSLTPNELLNASPVMDYILGAQSGEKFGGRTTQPIHHTFFEELLNSPTRARWVQRQIVEVSWRSSAALLYQLVYDLDQLPVEWKAVRQDIDQHIADAAPGELANFWSGLYGRLSVDPSRFPHAVANILRNNVPEKLWQAWCAMKEREFERHISLVHSQNLINHTEFRMAVSPSQRLIDIVCAGSVTRERLPQLVASLLLFVGDYDFSRNKELMQHLLTPVLNLAIEYKSNIAPSAKNAPPTYCAFNQLIIECCISPLLADIVSTCLPFIYQMDVHVPLGRAPTTGESSLWTLLCKHQRLDVIEAIQRHSSRWIPLSDWEDSVFQKMIESKSEILIGIYLVTVLCNSRDNPSLIIQSVDSVLSKMSPVELFPARFANVSLRFFLWNTLVGTEVFDSRRMPLDQYTMVLKWYASWDQNRVRKLLKIGTDLISASMDSDTELGKAPPIVSMLSILGARENWDGFVSTAASFIRVFASKRTEQSLVDLLNWACMIGYFKLGNVDRARKSAVQIASGLVPGLSKLFACFGGLEIFEQLYYKHNGTTAASTSSSSASSSAVVSASTATSLVASAVTKKKKKKRKKGSAAAPGAEPAESSSQAAASSQSVADAEPEVQYEPDSKPQHSVSSSSMQEQAPEASPEQPQMVDAVEEVPEAGVVFAECPICYVNFPGGVLVPCGHTFCVICIKKLSVCSICRSPADKWIRFFISQGEQDD